MLSGKQTPEFLSRYLTSNFTFKVRVFIGMFSGMGGKGAELYMAFIAASLKRLSVESFSMLKDVIFPCLFIVKASSTLKSLLVPS